MDMKWLSSESPNTRTEWLASYYCMFNIQFDALSTKTAGFLKISAVMLPNLYGLF